MLSKIRENQLNSMITNIIMIIIVFVAIILYFANNPLKHSKEFRIRCFWNWFPLGLTYAFMYMGRYNLTVATGAMGDLITKQNFGDIFGIGAVTYGLAFLINGPLTDKMGGKKAILLGTAGAILANALMGVSVYCVLNGIIDKSMIVPAFIVLYSVNMYFQSFGAVSVIKVNSSWFHIKERGIQGGVFGTLIALGLFYAFNWGDIIVKASKAKLPEHMDLIESALRFLIGSANAKMDQTWYVFFIPAIILAFFFVLLVIIVKDHPSQAGFEDFDLGDASNDLNEESVIALYKRLLANPVILTIAFIEFCSGVIRQSIMHWYKIFVSQNPAKLAQGASFFIDNWGLLLCFAGIFGGFVAGYISDKLFQSRRGPSAVFLYAAMFVFSVLMYFTLEQNQILLGIAVLLMSLCVIGVHGMLSGAATMDFGGKKAAATTTGLVDGFVYLGTGLQGFVLGRLTSMDWSYWPLFMIPFTIVGLVLSVKIWKAFPDRGAKS